MSFRFLKWDLHKLGQIKSDIASLESSLQRETIPSEFQEASKIITTYNMALTSDLSKIQKKEFQREGIQDSSTGAFMDHHHQSSNTTKKTHSRRFKRRNIITANNNVNADTCPVLNVSSVTLSDSETSLLSNGLDFCRTPCEVSDQQLREDTRAFFRRLRLKEHFSRKNSKEDSAFKPQDATDCILENHPLYRPTSTWEPPPGKC
jgi:hypothetical protein